MDTLENYNGMLGLKVRPMTEVESRLFIILSITPEKVVESQREQMSDPKKIPFVIAVLVSRLQDPLLVDLKTILLCSSFCRTPGQSVMWAFTLTRMLERKNWQRITIDDWVNAFPMGIPIEEEQLKAWDAQKRTGLPPRNMTDNLLDDVRLWPRKPNEV